MTGALERDVAPVVVGVNLKLYFGYRATLDWCARVAAIASANPAIVQGDVELFVLPSAPALVDAAKLLRPARVRVGAQNLYWQGAGAYTGELDAATLVEVGCEIVALGHAERRALFGETDRDVALKVAAAVDGGLTPLICVGEHERLPAAAAAAESVRQLESAVSALSDSDPRVVVAYEPVWAIGAESPAATTHINAVCGALQAGARSLGLTRSSTIYGGTAGPGLWAELSEVDGIFLGRRAHEPAALERVLEEVATTAPTFGVARP